VSSFPYPPPLFGIFSIFAATALLSVVLVLLIRPRDAGAAQPLSP